MSERVIITGSNGLLGQKLIKLFLKKSGYEIHGLSRGENRMASNKGYKYHDIDLLDKEDLLQTLHQIEPDIIIHTAAMTNVDACELNQEVCDQMNIEVVSYMIDYCRDKKVYLLHLSTDFIFDGEKGAIYKEEDMAHPVNHYGLSKWESEKLLLNSEVEHAILRTILVYGIVDRNDRSNIVLWVKSSLENKQEIRVVTDQHRMPTYAEDLAEACWLAVSTRARGVYNVSSNTLMSIYEIALTIADVFKLDKKLIVPVTTSALSLPAKRPFSTGFDLNKSVSEINLTSYSFLERLQVFKDQLYSVEGAAKA